MLRKLKLCVVLFLAVIFTGCKEYGEKRIVTLLTVDTETVSVYYYDFSKKEPAYLKIENKNNGIKNSLVNILSQEEYNLKLCKYAVVSEDIVKNSIRELFFALTDTRFAPDIVILEGDTKKDAEEYKELSKENYPIYSYKVAGENINGIVEKTDGGEKNIIVNNSLYKTIDGRQSFVMDILNKSIDIGSYYFQKDSSAFLAELDNISTFFRVKDDTLCIDITATLKSYKGMPAGETYKKQFIDFLQESIEKEAKLLLSDKTLSETFDLLWYRNLEDFKAIAVNVNIL